MLVVEGRCGWLIARDYYEAIAVVYPGHILNYRLKDGHVLSFGASKDLNILECVLAIVALPARVTQVLRPNEHCVTRLRKLQRNLLPLVTLNEELAALNFGLVQIVDENCAILVTFRQKVGRLPSEEILRRILLRICTLCVQWT